MSFLHLGCEPEVLGGCFPFGSFSGHCGSSPEYASLICSLHKLDIAIARSRQYAAIAAIAAKPQVSQKCDCASFSLWINLRYCLIGILNCRYGYASCLPGYRPAF